MDEYFKVIGEVEEIKIHTLTELGLYPEFHSLLNNHRIHTFNKFQAVILSQLLSPKDNIFVNPPGTGVKTSCLFAIYKQIDTLSIVLAPTKEISLYFYNLITRFNLDIKGEKGSEKILKVELLVGDQETGTDIKKMKKRFDILIATPGRFLKICKVSKFFSRQVKLSLYLFEADILFSRSFEDQVNGILDIITCYEQKQSLFVKKIAMASCIPYEILRFIRKKMRAFPGRVELYNKIKKPSKEQLKEIIVVANDRKSIKLHEVIAELPNYSKIIIFCNNNHTCRLLYKTLMSSNLEKEVLCYETSIDIKDRLKELNLFANIKEKGLLVTTGDAINFLSLENINTVINFDFVTSKEDYFKKIYHLACLRENYSKPHNKKEFYVINFIEQANLKGVRILQKSLLNRNVKDNSSMDSLALKSDIKPYLELVKICDSKHIKYDRLVYYKYRKGYSFSKQENSEFRKKQKILFEENKKLAIKEKLQETRSLQIGMKKKSLLDVQLEVFMKAFIKINGRRNEPNKDLKYSLVKEYENGIKNQINSRNIINNILKEKFNPFVSEESEVYETFDLDTYRHAYIGFIDLEECSGSTKWKILNLIGYSRTKYGSEVSVEIKGNFSHTQFNYDSDERMYMLFRSHKKETLDKAMHEYLKKIYELI